MIQTIVPFLGVIAILVVLAYAARSLGNLSASRPRIYVLPDLRGPSAKTVVPPLIRASWSTYSRAGRNNLAILLTDTASSWLGLARGLATIGVPFTITTDWHSALTHRVVWVYPRISGATLSGEALRALGAVPRNGGTLIGTEIVGGGLEEVFGFDSAFSSRQRQSLHFGATGATRFNFTDDLERTIRIGATATTATDSVFLGSYGYRATTGEALANFDDGTAGVLHRTVGLGHAYVFGVDLGSLLQLGYDNREEGRFARSYVNGYEPSLDVLLRIVRAIYSEGEPDAVTIGTVPDGRALSVVLSHDIDFSKDWLNAMEFARFERSKGIRVTYFVQTKYMRDYNDEIFFDSSAIGYIASLKAMGMEIGSHSVAHSRQFAKMPEGDGTEAYPAYQPFVQDLEHTVDGTVLGEIRVSKFLLEHATGSPVISFRPGYLSEPFALPEALEAAGYRYSSSATANNSLTHLPFRLTYNRSSGGETNIFEFPVTVEDEAPPVMNKRLDAALLLAKRLSNYGGLFVLLTHTNVTAEKLAFEQDLVAQVSDKAWIGSVDQLGAWWAARDRVRIQVTDSGDVRALELHAPIPLDGLSLTVPAGWRLIEPKANQTIQTGQTVAIRHVDPNLFLFFRTR
jgi:peptidoglycan/xylan/chitin deacetylase (PgdA/CDA1 family)